MKSSPKTARPTEAAEQAAVVRWLRRHKVFFAAIPNGGLRTGKGGAAQRTLGVLPGMPDLLIFDPPPAPGRFPFFGVALEMKRTGGNMSDVSEMQEKVFHQFIDVSWKALVGYGAADAIEKLEALGYGGERE